MEEHLIHLSVNHATALLDTRTMTVEETLMNVKILICARMEEPVVILMGALSACAFLDTLELYVRWTLMSAWNTRHVCMELA